jgi:para-nitrobenzyl esterase
MAVLADGDIPFLWGTYTPEDIAALPPFQGIDLGRVSVISSAMRAMYVEFMRTGSPGADWQAFDRDGWNILWFGEQLEMRPGLLRDEWDLMTGTNVHDISTLADILTANGAAARQQAFRS